MTTSLEKYRVTLRCRPDDPGNGPAAEDGMCVRLYSIFAEDKHSALEKAFTIHAQNCDQACGNCEITTEAELDDDDVVE